jgi:hypothetical protein
LGPRYHAVTPPCYHATLLARGVGACGARYRATTWPYDNTGEGRYAYTPRRPRLPPFLGGNRLPRHQTTRRRLLGADYAVTTLARDHITTLSRREAHGFGIKLPSCNAFGRAHFRGATPGRYHGDSMRLGPRSQATILPGDGVPPYCGKACGTTLPCVDATMPPHHLATTGHGRHVAMLRCEHSNMVPPPATLTCYHASFCHANHATMLRP